MASAPVPGTLQAVASGAAHVTPACSILEAQHWLEPPGRSPQPGPPQPPQLLAQQTWLGLGLGLGLG